MKNRLLVGAALCVTPILTQPVSAQTRAAATTAKPDAAVAVLHQLADLGIGLSIDDFGTGHASLSYLRHLPVREIKIDKSFVLGLAERTSDQSIVRAILELGHALDYAVTAEGVENLQSIALLRKMGCDFVQGFLIARPLPAEDFTHFSQHWGKDRSGPDAISMAAP